MKKLFAIAFLAVSGCSTLPPQIEEPIETPKLKPMIFVNPGSVIHTSVTKAVMIFPKDIVIDITDKETLVTFTDEFSGNRTTVQGDIDMTFLTSKDYTIRDWRKK